MAHEKHLIHGLVIEAVPADGTGHDMLTRDPATGLVTKISGSPLLTTLPEGQFWIGNSSNIATPVLPSGDVTFNTSGLFDITPGVIVNADISATADIEVSKLESLVSNRLVITDGSGKLTVANVTDTEAGFLSGASSNIQTQLNAKQTIITGAATTITSNNLTANRAVISNASGKVSVSAATSAEVAHLSGVHTPIQTQLDTKLTVSLTSVAQGDLIMFNGSQWVNLGKGTDGQVLTATATSIEWDDSSASGLPTGGTTNQYLKKNSNTNFDTVWDTLELSDITDITASAAEVNILTGATLTTTELNFVDGVTSPIQTQLNEKQSRSLGYNNLWVGGSSNIAVQLPPGAEDEVLTIVGGSPQWQPVDPPGDVSGPVSSTDNAVARFNGVTGDAIDHPVTPVLLDDSGNFVFPTGTGLRTGTSDTNTLILAAYDVDGTSYTTFATLTAGNTPTFDLHTDTTIGSSYPYRVGGTDVSLADGGTGSSLSDPGVDAVFVWDNTLNQTRLATLDGLTYNSGTNILTATGGGGSGHVIEDNGTPLTARNNLNFRGGLSAADNNPDTDVFLGGELFDDVVISGDSGTYGISFLDMLEFDVGTGDSSFTVDASAIGLIHDVSSVVLSSSGISLAANTRQLAITPTAIGFTLGSDATGDIFYRNSSGHFTRLPIGTNGQVLSVSGGLPTWSSASATYTDEQAQDAVGNIFAPSSTITFNYDDGTPTITASVNANSITDSLLRTSLGLSVIGRSTSGSGNVADITASADNTILRRSGSSLAFGTISATGGAITSSPGVLLGRTTASTGPIENISVGSNLLDFSSGTLSFDGIQTANTTINAGAFDFIFDGDGTFSGAQYASDFSANYTARSLTDVDYVDSILWEDVTTTTYLFTEADKTKVKRFTHASGCVATVPTGLSTGWNVLLYRATGAGIVTIASNGTLEAAANTMETPQTFASIFHRGSNIHAAGGALGSSGGGGGISSIGLVMPSIFGVAPYPLTANGDITVTLNTASPNQVFATDPAGGTTAPALRSLVDADLPNITWEDVAGTTYTFSANDNKKAKRFTNAGGCTATIPLGLDPGWSTLAYRATGAGAVTLVSSGTLEAENNILATEETAATIIHRGSNFHVALGALATGSGGSAHIIKNNGTPLTERPNLNFKGGLTASDNSPDTDVVWGGALAGNVTITGADTNSITFSGIPTFLVGTYTRIHPNAVNIGATNTVTSSTAGLMHGTTSTLSNTLSAVIAGEAAVSSGHGSLAIGRATTASGSKSFAGGWHENSTTPGFGPVASGEASFAFFETSGSSATGNGARARRSAILGGLNHNIASGNTGAAIIGGSGINLTGTDYIDFTAVSNLAIFSTPGDGATDDVLTWNATTKKVGKVSQASLGGGGGLVGSGVAGQVAYWADTDTLTGEAGFEYDAGNNRLTSDTIRVGSTAIAGNKTIDVESADGNADLILQPKSGSVNLSTTTLEFGVPTLGGSSKTLQLVGSATDIGLSVVPKGSGGILFGHANSYNLTLNLSGNDTVLLGGQASTNNVFRITSSAGGATSVNGKTIEIIPGSAYSVSGDGDGGSVLIQSGVRRVAGAGSDGNITIDALTGFLILANIPTSSAGLPSGAVWSNSGVLTLA